MDTRGKTIQAAGTAYAKALSPTEPVLELHAGLAGATKVVDEIGAIWESYQAGLWATIKTWVLL